MIDAHLHVWALPSRPGDPEYAWITPDLGVLHRTFTPAEAGSTLLAADVSGALLVQAEDSLVDTARMLQVCAEHDWALGAVGWVALDRPAQVGAQLDRWLEDPYFRGVRHLVHDDPRAFLELPEVRSSLGLLADAGLPFDVPDAFPRHLHQVVDLARAVPDLRIVIDHLGKPPLAEGSSSAAFAAWAAQLGAAAQLPNTVAKLSGLRIPGARYDVATLEPAVDLALDVFGAERLMYGGDWPMSVPGGGYRPTLDVLQELVHRLSPVEQDRIWTDTARAVYGL